MEAKPLVNVRVLDLTRVLAGPTASMILGDLGAEVIKLENPQSGDETRQWGPPFIQGESAYFFCANRNKRSIAIDLKKPESRNILERLALLSDVVMLNYPQGHLEKLGLTESFFRSQRPDIIWANISGFGLHGYKKNDPGYDLLIQGLSGLMSITGEPLGEPMKVGVAMADVLTALYTVIAIISALYQRKITFKGCGIDNSLLECTMASLVNVASSFMMNQKTPARFGNGHPNIVPYQVFKARDRYFILAVGNDMQWQKVCRLLERSDLSDNAQYRTNQDRVLHRESLVPILSSIFSHQDAEEWVSVFSENSIPCGLVKTLPDAFDEAVLSERNFIRTITHPLAGQVNLMANPIHFSHTDLSIDLPPPLLGEHTHEIMSGLLGYSEDEISVLMSKKVIYG